MPTSSDTPQPRNRAPHTSHRDLLARRDTHNRERVPKPTVHEAVRQFVDARRGAIKPKSHATLHSFLIGSTKRGGRPALGTPLARYHLANRRIHTVTDVEFNDWWRHRLPLDKTANNTLHSRAVYFNQFLAYCNRKGWVSDDIVIECRKSEGHDDPDPYWLRPDQVQALTQLVESNERFDAYREFVWHCIISTGVRTDEAVHLRVKDLDRREHQLYIAAGKGSGTGKSRYIGVDDSLIERWASHAQEHGLKPNDYVFFSREFHSLGGQRQSEGEWVTISHTRPAGAKTLRSFLDAVRTEAEIGGAAGSFDATLVPGFPLVPRVLRKTFACNQLILHRLNLGGLALEQLKSALGHNDIKTTQIYLPDVEKYLDLMSKPVNTVDAAKLILEHRRRLDEQATYDEQGRAS